MKKRALLILALAVMTGFFLVPVVRAGVPPQMINYQGTLTNSSGVPMANGNYDMEFKLYDVPSGGAYLWSEKWDTATSQVPVIDGIFNVMLGFQNPIPAGFFAEHSITYLGIKVGTDSEMLPRQQITSVGYAFAAGNGVPKGGIIMWSGAVDQIPDGWALCDKTNGTPDLRDRFIVGAGNGFAVGATGGLPTINLAHGHDYEGNTDVSTNDTVDRTKDGTLFSTASKDHKHHYSGTTQPELSAVQSILPPYYALAYIMKL